MRAAGPQGPLPASDIVIEGLPKFKLTKESLGKYMAGQEMTLC